MLQRVEVAQSPENKFREYLASRPRPQRFTTPQRQIVEFIFSQHNHFDAEQLCADLERAGYEVSRATVYRTLTKLVDAGLLTAMQFGPRVVYEHGYGYPQHEHLRCDQCGKMIEFRTPELETVYQVVCLQHEFRPSSHNLIVHGICRECNQARTTKRRLDLV